MEVARPEVRGRVRVRERLLGDGHTEGSAERRPIIARPPLDELAWRDSGPDGGAMTFEGLLGRSFVWPVRGKSAVEHADREAPDGGHRGLPRIVGGRRLGEELGEHRVAHAAPPAIYVSQGEDYGRIRISGPQLFEERRRRPVD